MLSVTVCAAPPLRPPSTRKTREGFLPCSCSRQEPNLRKTSHPGIKLARRHRGLMKIFAPPPCNQTKRTKPNLSSRRHGSRLPVARERISQLLIDCNRVPCEAQRLARSHSMADQRRRAWDLGVVLSRDASQGSHNAQLSRRRRGGICFWLVIALAAHDTGASMCDLTRGGFSARPARHPCPATAPIIDQWPSYQHPSSLMARDDWKMAEKLWLCDMARPLSAISRPGLNDRPARFSTDQPLNPELIVRPYCRIIVPYIYSPI